MLSCPEEFPLWMGSPPQSVVAWWRPLGSRQPGTGVTGTRQSPLIGLSIGATEERASLGANAEHKLLDVSDVPGTRLGGQLRVDAVGRDGHLGSRPAG